MGFGFLPKELIGLSVTQTLLQALAKLNGMTALKKAKP
jgi:hypothetical protein